MHIIGSIILFYIGNIRLITLLPVISRPKFNDLVISPTRKTIRKHSSFYSSKPQTQFSRAKISNASIDTKETIHHIESCLYWMLDMFQNHHDQSSTQLTIIFILMQIKYSYPYVNIILHSIVKFNKNRRFRTFPAGNRSRLFSFSRRFWREQGRALFVFFQKLFPLQRRSRTRLSPHFYVGISCCCITHRPLFVMDYACVAFSLSDAFCDSVRAYLDSETLKIDGECVRRLYRRALFSER